MKGDTRCIEGRLWRHDPQHDDPYLETEIGLCPECEGADCATFHKDQEDEPYERLQTPAPGKHVTVRGTMRNSDGAIMNGHYAGIVREVKRNGDCLVLESGWHLNLDLGDELIWCADQPAPGNLR